MPKTKRPSTRAERKAKTPATVPQKFTPKFLEQCDQRQSVIKLIKSRLERLVDEAGIESYQKELLARRAVFVSVQLETMEANALDGEPIDLGVYQQGVNCLSGLLTKLGLEKQLKDAGDLSDYLKTSGSRKR